MIYCASCRGEMTHLHTQAVNGSAGAAKFVNWWCAYCGSITTQNGEDNLHQPSKLGQMFATSWQNDGFIVAQARRDGTAPTIEKAIDQKFQLTEDAAKRVCDDICTEIGPYYGVFPVTVVIPKGQPSYRPEKTG